MFSVFKNHPYIISSALTLLGSVIVYFANAKTPLKRRTLPEKHPTRKERRNGIRKKTFKNLVMKDSIQHVLNFMWKNDMPNEWYFQMISYFIYRNGCILSAKIDKIANMICYSVHNKPIVDTVLKYLKTYHDPVNSYMFLKREANDVFNEQVYDFIDDCYRKRYRTSLAFLLTMLEDKQPKFRLIGEIYMKYTSTKHNEMFDILNAKFPLNNIVSLNIISLKNHRTQCKLVNNQHILNILDKVEKDTSKNNGIHNYVKTMLLNAQHALNNIPYCVFESNDTDSRDNLEAMHCFEVALASGSYNFIKYFMEKYEHKTKINSLYRQYMFDSFQKCLDKHYLESLILLLPYGFYTGKEERTISIWVKLFSTKKVKLKLVYILASYSKKTNMLNRFITYSIKNNLKLVIKNFVKVANRKFHLFENIAQTSIENIIEYCYTNNMKNLSDVFLSENSYDFSKSMYNEATPNSYAPKLYDMEQLCMYFFPKKKNGYDSEYFYSVHHNYIRYIIENDYSILFEAYINRKNYDKKTIFMFIGTIFSVNAPKCLKYAISNPEFKEMIDDNKHLLLQRVLDTHNLSCLPYFGVNPPLSEEELIQYVNKSIVSDFSEMFKFYTDILKSNVVDKLHVAFVHNSHRIVNFILKSVFASRDKELITTCKTTVIGFKGTISTLMFIVLCRYKQIYRIIMNKITDETINNGQIKFAPLEFISCKLLTGRIKFQYIELIIKMCANCTLKSLVTKEKFQNFMQKESHKMFIVKQVINLIKYNKIQTDDKKEMIQFWFDYIDLKYFMTYVLHHENSIIICEYQPFKDMLLKHDALCFSKLKMSENL
jgi:hypothetical protein